MARKSALAKDPKASPGRDPREMDRYKRNQEIIKKAKPGTPEYDKALKGLERVGKMYGLNWQQHVPGGKPGRTPQTQVPTVEAPVTQNPLVNQQNPNMANQPTLQAQDNLMSSQYANMYGNMLGQSSEFDPNTFQQNYNPQFEQGMQKAYDTVYNEFDRRNAQRLQQEQQQMEQSIVERGLDPSGEAAQNLRMQLSQRQADERQGAQNAAWQAAQGYQQQGFNQAQTASLLPGEISQQYQNLFMQMQGQRGNQAQSFQEFNQGMALSQQDLQNRQQMLAQEARNQERLLNLGGRWDLRKIAATPRGGGGGMDPYAAWEAQFLGNQIAGGYPQGQGGQSMGNAALTSFAQGAGGALVNNMNRK
jgi:hypothetical protein